MRSLKIGLSMLIKKSTMFRILESERLVRVNNDGYGKTLMSWLENTYLIRLNAVIIKEISFTNKLGGTAD